MQYGCETWLLDEWTAEVEPSRTRLRALCERHEPNRADVYERAIAAWLELVRTVVTVERTRPEQW